MTTTNDNQAKTKKKDLRVYGTTDPKVKEMIALGVPPGQFNTALQEEFPAYDAAPGEHVTRGQNNADIVIGRDRSGSMASGKGGNGETRCGAIDIVCGRLSGFDALSPATGEIKTGPNFCLDATRLYLTQRGDVDSYFALSSIGSRCPPSENRSAAAMKADHVRLIGRESIKIYAGKGMWEGTGFYGEPLSTSGENRVEPVIELTAAGKSVQPAVRGDNLMRALRHLFEQQRKMLGMINSIHMVNMKSLAHDMPHTHPVVALGAGVAVPDVSKVVGGVQAQIKHICGHINTILGQMNNYMEEFNAVGIGPDSAKIPGNDTIISNTVYIS